MTNPLDRLRKGVQQAGSQKAYAKELGISLAYLNDVLHGRRKVSAQLAQRIGLVRETKYREDV